MKKALLTKLMLLLCALIAGSSSVWATDIVYTQVTAANQLNDGDEVLIVSTFPTKSIAMLSTVSTTSTKYMTVSEVTISNNNTITLADNSPITVWTIEKNESNYSFKSGNNYIISNSSSSNSANVSTTLDNKAKHTIENVTDGLFQFKNVENTSKYLKGGNSGDRFAYYASGTNNTQWVKLFKKPADNRAATTVTLNTGYSTEAYMEEAVVSPSLNKVSTASADIDGATVTWSSSNTSVATIADDGVITLVAPGSTTIKARYAGDETNYKPSEASYELKVYGSYTTLEQIHSAVSTTETKVKYTFANEYITFVSSDKKNIYISDGTRGMVIYNSTAYSSDAIVVGAKLSGSIKTKFKDFNGTVEFTTISDASLTALINGTENVTASTKAIDAIAKENQSTLVKIENVTFDGNTDAFTVGVNSIKYSKKFNSQDLTNNATYDITGIIIMLSNELYIAPRAAADISLKSTQDTPQNAWYTDNGKGTALSTITINKADGNVSYFFDTNSTGTVTYESSVTTVATVDENTGEITPVGYGTTIITANTAGNSDFYASSTSFTLNVKDDFVDLLLPGNVTFSGDNYCAWSNISGLWSGATYAGNSYKGSTRFQLKVDDGVGIVVTGSVGRVKKITIAWNSGTTTDRTLNVYGTNTPYTTVGVGSNEVSLGSFSSNTQNVTELTVDAAKNYGYIRIAAAGGALYLDKIQIEWDKDVRCVETGQYEWATFVSDQILDFENTGVKAYTVTGHSGNAITKSDALTTVPANTPLLLNAAEGTYAIPVAASSSTNVDGNLLKAGTGAAVSAEANKTKYVLSVKEGNAAFKKINATAATVPTDKAYLEFDEVINAPFLDFYNETTSIDDVRSKMSDVRGEIYNLNGQRVAQPTKGLYIVNGKKYIFK